MCAEYEAATGTLKQHGLAAASAYKVCTEPPYPNAKSNGGMTFSFHQGRPPQSYNVHNTTLSQQL